MNVPPYYTHNITAQDLLTICLKKYGTLRNNVYGDIKWYVKIEERARFLNIFIRSARLLGIPFSILNSADFKNNYLYVVSLNNTSMKIKKMEWNRFLLKLVDIYPIELQKFSIIKNHKNHKKRKQLSPKLRFSIFQESGYKCYYCGVRQPDCGLEVDHVIPVSKGGTNNIDNLRASCKQCNIGKSDKIIDLV